MNPSEKFIIELSREQIELLSALTHYYIQHSDGDNDVRVGKEVIDEFMMQTSFVQREAEKHGIKRRLLVYGFNTTATKWGDRVTEVFGSLVPLDLED